MTKEEIQYGYVEHAKVDTNAPKHLKCPAYYTHDGWFQGAEWAEKEIIEKATELYKEEMVRVKNMLNYFKRDAGDIIDLEKSVEIFKKNLGG